MSLWSALLSAAPPNPAEQPTAGDATNQDDNDQVEPQHRIERSSILLLGNRIDPDEHAIDVQKLFSHLVSHVIRIDRGFRGNS